MRRHGISRPCTCHGRPETLDVRETSRHIRDCVEHLGTGREDRWSLKELGHGGMKRRLPHVLGFRLPIERLHVKFKMGQDEPIADTQAAIGRLADDAGPALAELMRLENEGRK
jgi:transcriptional regulator